MKHFIKIKNSTFSISNSMADALTKSNLNFQTKIQNEKQIYILTESNFSLLQPVPTTSQTHFYIALFGKKLRTTKLFYDYVDTFKNNVEKRMLMADLFSGTGSALLASKNLSIKHSFSNDFCKNSKKIFESNFSSPLNNSSISDLDVDIIPNHDILIGGFPCQPFSIAGYKKGLHDSRSDVFWDIVRIVNVKRPRFILLENVKHLNSINQGKTLDEFIRSLNDLGYWTKVQVLDVAKITGLPQHRERLFIFCFLEKIDFQAFNFNFLQVENKRFFEYLDASVPSKYYISKKSKLFNLFTENVTQHVKTGRLYHYRRSTFRKYLNVCPTLTANMGTGGHNVPIIKDDFGIRKLTPRECFRLQGFPDSYKLIGSDSALYKLVGNAICVNVLNIILKKFQEVFVKI